MAGERDERRGPRRDQPTERGVSLRPTVDPERVGRLSERIARFLGSWRFIGYMTGFIIAWVFWNTLGPKELRFDEWQFIGLTLLLSLQASYAAPLILLAQNDIGYKNLSFLNSKGYLEGFYYNPRIDKQMEWMGPLPKA